jgi:hypothetical protein
MEARVKGVLADVIRAEEVTPALLSALQEGLLQALAEKGLLTPAQYRRAEEIRQGRPGDRRLVPDLRDLRGSRE